MFCEFCSVLWPLNGPRSLINMSLVPNIRYSSTCIYIRAFQKRSSRRLFSKCLQLTRAVTGPSDSL